MHPPRPIRAPALLALLLSTFAACRGEGDARDAARGAAVDSGAVVTDAAGRTVRFDRPPTRIVSLIPAVTQMIVELGDRDALVGRTDFDTLAAVASLPSVGGGLQPDLERLLTLRPDLVIRFEGEQDRVTGAALDQRGIANLGLRPDRLEDVRAITTEMGRILGRPEAADSLLGAIDRQLAETRARVGSERRVKVAYILGGTPPWIAGPGSFIADLIDVAGADNAFADLGALYAPVSLENLLSRDVDVFLTGRGTRVSPRLAQRAPVIEVSTDVESPGTGLGRSALELARALHPDAFR